MVKVNKQGFTMVELLVVLVIVGILAAVATPLYLQHTKRARMSEAVSTMGLIRQAERDFKVNKGKFFDVTIGNLNNALPDSALDDGTPQVAGANDLTRGLDIDVAVTQYFSRDAFTIASGNTQGTNTPTSARFANPPVQDFLISVKGEETDVCSAGVLTNCAVKGLEVQGNDVANGPDVYNAEMDNSGRVFVCYTNCGTAANWSAY